MNITLSIIVVFCFLSINTSSSFSVKHYKNIGFKNTNNVIKARNHLLLGGNCYDLKEAPAAAVVTGGVTFSKRIPPQQSRVQSKTLLHAFSSPSSNEILSSVSRGAGSSLNIASLLHQDDVYVLSFVMLLSTCGLSLERRTKIGKALSVSERECLEYVFSHVNAILVKYLPYVCFQRTINVFCFIHIMSMFFCLYCL
jgi:hypothetical protein